VAEIHDLKLRVARRLRKPERRVPAGQRALPFGQPPQSPRAFWQVRFYDFNVYTEKKKKEKLEYMQTQVLSSEAGAPAGCSAGELGGESQCIMWVDQ
jgi:hypothetical protein